MRSLRVGLFTALCLVLLIATTAQAGIREGAFSLSPMLGIHGFEGDQAVDDSLVAGLSLGYNISKRWAAELEVRYTDAEITPDTGPESDLEIWSGALNALYHFNVEERFVPYISAGFGGMYFEGEGFDADSDYMMNWGVGAKYFFSDDLAFRADVRHVIDFHSDREWDRTSGDDVDHNYLATAGLFWQFGGPAPPPPPPADSDGDGIPDTRDKCPDTPLGVMVDAVGCPPVEKPLPQPKPYVDGDDDGDGVPNSRDRCPGTEKGIMVDEHGCPIKFTMHIEFEFDKAAVRPEYHEKLAEASAFIHKYPATSFLIAGHTDSKGTDEYNEGLSMRRAEAVKQYLIDEFGIDAKLLNPRGYGESQPIDTNDTDAGRQRNRRVEVICCVVDMSEQ